MLQSLLLIETEINLVQHVFRLAFQFIVRHRHEANISKVDWLIVMVAVMFSLLTKRVQLNIYIQA